MGEILNPDTFKDKPQEAIDKQVCFTALEYSDAVATLPTQSVLIFDEGAQAWHHRDFQRETNIVLSKIQIGFRFKRFKNFLCVPYLELVDKDARGLAHFLVNILRQGEAEVFRIVPPKLQGVLWFPKIIDSLSIKLPGVQLRHAYEKKKEQVQNDLYEKMSKDLRRKDTAPLSKEEMLETIRRNPDPFLKHGRLYVPGIMARFDVGRAKAEVVRELYAKEAEN